MPLSLEAKSCLLILSPVLLAMLCFSSTCLGTPVGASGNLDMIWNNLEALTLSLFEDSPGTCSDNCNDLSSLGGKSVIDAGES